jgi:predicted nucleic acid-binding protein
VKIVFDTNVLLAGIFTRGVCEAVLDACLLSPSHAVFASEYILSEFVDRAIVKFKIPANLADDAIRFLRRQITVVQAAAP